MPTKRKHGIESLGEALGEVVHSTPVVAAGESLAKLGREVIRRTPEPIRRVGRRVRREVLRQVSKRRSTRSSTSRR